jgi:predicted RNase H-like nuclease (RuvC/YqgF family)
LNTAHSSASHLGAVQKPDYGSDLALSYKHHMKNDKQKDIVEQNAEKLLIRGKYRSFVLELEIKLAERLKALKEMDNIDEDSDHAQRRYLKVYSELFDDIIACSPFAHLLTQIKNAYEKNPNTPTTLTMRKSYENTMIKYSQATIQAKNYKDKMDNLTKEVEKLNGEIFNLKDTIKILRKDLKEVKHAKHKLVLESKSNSVRQQQEQTQETEVKNILDLPPFE